MINQLTKNIIMLSIGAIICLVLGVFALKPSLANLSNLNTQLDEKNTEVANLQQQIQAYQTAESDLNHATRKQEIADSILPKEQLVTAIHEVEQAANLTGTAESMRITDPFVPVDTNAPPPVKSDVVIPQVVGTTQVPYQLTTTSNYVSLIDFMSYMEHLPNFTEISKIQLNAETITGGTNNALPIHTGRIISTIDGIFYVKK